MIDKELEQYYNTYRDLFANAGFKLLVQDLANNANVINSVEATKDNHGMINTLSSKAFYQKLRNEVYSFRKLIDKFMP